MRIMKNLRRLQSVPTVDQLKNTINITAAHWRLAKLSMLSPLHMCTVYCEHLRSLTLLVLYYQTLLLLAPLLI